MTDLTTVEFLTTLAAATVRLAVPVMFAGLGETIAEKTGILNIGIEGVMLSGAFFAFAGAWYSKSLMAGILCGMLGGVFISSIHGFLSINMAKDQTVSGLALNIFALGFTSYFFKLMQNGSEYQQIDSRSFKAPCAWTGFFRSGYTYLFDLCAYDTGIYFLQKNKSRTVVFCYRRKPQGCCLRRYTRS